MATFTCEVCFEARETRLDLTALSTGNGDILRAADCEHPVCQECMAKFVRARVEEQQVFGIRCPHEGCKNQIFELDLKKLVERELLPAAVHARFAELRTRDYAERARELANTGAAGDLELVRRLWETSRLCPRCSLIIEKASGCNSFYCICGNHFNYESAPRAVGNGFKCKTYNRVISMAEDFKLQLRLAEALGGDWKAYFQASRTAERLGVPLEEAASIHKRAREGDEAARASIRSMRTARREEVCDEESCEESYTCDGGAAGL